jgi:probable selenium-dependent hydroxylase accessory protein YqeC
MRYIDEFNIDINKNELFTVVGAGGKTTTIFSIAKELKAFGKKVLIATTTMIFYPVETDYDEVLIVEDYDFEILKSIEAASITVIGSKVSEEGKILGTSCNSINKIFKSGIFDFILVEGDGSKRKPIKAPAEHEPVIPEETTILIGVVGMDSLGMEINADIVHRPEIFCSITDSRIGDKIDFDMILKLIVNPKGLFKGAKPNMKKRVFLNKLDNSIGNEKIIEMKNRISLLDNSIEGVAINYFNHM